MSRGGVRARRLLVAAALALSLAGAGGCGRTTLDPGPAPPSELIPSRPLPPYPLPSDPFPPGPALVRFAVIGDYGLDSEPEARVARMVASWHPDFVITTGDNNYPLGEASTIDVNIGKHYAQFIGNYRGAYGPGSAINRFWPSPGNHDWDTGTLEPYLNYFTLPGNGRYYDVVVGPVHLFALDSDPREPDGMTEDSVQARWLEATMTASSACFQVAYFHHPAYSSSMHGSTVAMRWPFEAWGADAVFAGHDHVYERSRSGGIRHFTIGTSGAEAYGFGTPLPESEARFAGERGALLVTVGKTAKEWLKPIIAKKQFAYLATIEPHVAYTPRKEFLVKYWDKAYTGPIKPVQSGVQLGLIKGGKLKVTDNDKKYLEALHDAEISQSDAAFAAFIGDLKQLGIYEKSAIIVVSDHGDQFYEHGSVGHGDTVYQELVHVPLMIRAPGVFPAGKVVHADVEAMDVYATMLDLAGVQPGANVAGTTLVPLARDEVGGTPRAALTVDGQVSRGIKVQRYRMVHRGPGRIELYDEYDDPREQKDVAAERPIALRGMRGVLGLLYAYETTWSKSRWGTAANVNEAFYTAAGAPGRRGAEPKSGGPK